MFDDKFLPRLEEFLLKAFSQTYAGNGKPTEKPERAGFIEMIYEENPWHYLDSYTGYFRSWGQELVRFGGEPFWICEYGGGMEDKYHEDSAFASQTFDFLKKALLAKKDIPGFIPRGPQQFKEKEFEYKSEWTGDVSSFKGSEIIRFKDESVFNHDFIGGLIIPVKS